MSIPSAIVSIISKVSPVIGTALGGPAGSIVGTLVSTALGGVDMRNADDVARVINSNPESVQKLKELELQLTDLQNARIEASKETGAYKLVRPILAIFAMIAIFADIMAIEYVENQVVSQVLIVMLVVLVWDIRQIYKFYFGSSDEIPNMPFINKRK